MCTERAILADKLEKHLVALDRWHEAPAEAQRLAEAAGGERMPHGIGYTEETGWFVLCTAGQGPCIVWMEKEE